MTEDSSAGSSDADAPALAIGIARGELCALAARPFRAGDRILDIAGEPLDAPSGYSIQVDEHVHVGAPVASTRERLQLGFAWRYINHACTPNAVVRERAIFALRDIAAAAEVCCRYDADQYELAEPFNCLCGTEGCAGRITGYRDLGPGQREKFAGIVQPHVMAEAARRERDSG